MGTWKYRKPEPTEIRGLCVICNKNPQKKFPKGFRSYCSPCSKKLYENRGSLKKPSNTKSYRKFKKTKCEFCLFEGHYCQFDVDHIDGNHLNNELSNLMTLCANCHRLKTFTNKDWKPSV